MLQQPKDDIASKSDTTYFDVQFIMLVMDQPLGFFGWLDWDKGSPDYLDMHD